MDHQNSASLYGSESYKFGTLLIVLLLSNRRYLIVVEFNP